MIFVVIGFVTVALLLASLMALHRHEYRAATVLALAALAGIIAQWWLLTLAVAPLVRLEELGP